MHPNGCMNHIDCPTCHASIDPTPPRGARTVNAAMWVCSILLAVAACLPLAGLLVLPLWFLALWGLGVSASRMSTTQCPVCHHMVARPSTEPRPLFHHPHAAHA